MTNRLSTMSRLALTSMLYLVGAVLIFFLPETRGRELA